MPIPFQGRLFPDFGSLIFCFEVSIEIFKEPNQGVEKFLFCTFFPAFGITASVSIDQTPFPIEFHLLA